MRVLMVSSFHHARGGDTTYARAITRGLEAAGHEVLPFAMRHPDNDPSPWEARFPSWVDPWGAEGVLARARLLPKMIWSRESARALEGVLRDARPELAHLHHVHRHLTPSVLGPLRAAGMPVLWTVHDAELICPAGTLYAAGAPCERCRGHRYGEAVRHRCKGDALLPSLAVALEKSAHRLLDVWGKVDRLLCPSRFMADALIRFGLDAGRVHHLPNPLEARAIPAAEGAGEGWLYAGRLAPEKGIDTLLEAARRLPAARLTLAGAGPWEAKVRALLPELPQVRLLGQLPRARLLAQIRAAAVVVVPSRWPENFPYAVLEAQASGRAVVASRVGGIPEQIEHGVDGLLVPPGDAGALAEAVGGLLADPARAARLGAAGRRRVLEQRRPEPHLDALLAHYAAARREAIRS